ncbi:MAG: prepilin-type N-terminal cleavage/methylation domain-containing protein [Vulcanimicrobiota bacterium]
MSETKRSAGFTLIEVLVVSGITLLLFALVIQVYFGSQTAVGHTVDKVEAVQNARHLVDKLTPVVAVACDPNPLGAQPVRVILPEDGPDPDMASPTALEIITTEDLLAEDYVKRRNQFVERRDLRAFRFRAVFEPAEQRLVLRQMSATDPTEFDDDVPPRILGTALLGLQFLPAISDSSLINVTVRTEQKISIREAGEVRVIETSAVLPVPSESLR